ncbi:MAG: methyltransferase [Acidimicrobiales bacterium]
MAATTPADQVDPSRLVEIATGYMAAKQLFAAAEADLFTLLSKEELSAAELGAKAGIPERTARILADSMASLGLVVRDGGRYRAGDLAKAYLCDGSTEIDLRPFLSFLDSISYPHWSGFGETVGSGDPRPLDLGGDRLSTFMRGVMTYNALHARMLASVYDYSPHRRLLDVGGLSAAFVAEALKQNPQLKATFFTRQEMAGSARSILEGAGLGDRAEVREGDPQVDPIPTGHDLVLLEHVVHRFNAEQNEHLLSRVRQSSETGTRLILLDFFLDSDARQRTIDSLHAGEYLVIDGTVVYPETEVVDWMRSAGWALVEKRDVPGSPRILIAEAL